MVTVSLHRSTDGCLSTLAMSGHVSPSEGKRGANLTCAAVTGLVRSCVEAITMANGVVVSGSAEHEGLLSVAVSSVENSRLDWLNGVTDVLTVGLRRMAADEPGELELLER